MSVNEIIITLLEIMIALVSMLIPFALLGLIFHRMLLAQKARSSLRCPNCRTHMTGKRLEYFSLPIGRYGIYKKSADYYRTNTKKVHRKYNLKNDARACRMQEFECPKCGKRQIFVIDFVKDGIREMVKRGAVYPYEELASNLNTPAELPSSDTSPNTPTEKWIVATYAIWAEYFGFDCRYIGGSTSRSERDVERMCNALSGS